MTKKTTKKGTAPEKPTAAEVADAPEIDAADPHGVEDSNLEDSGPVKVLIITAPKKGFRRAGVSWQGTTEVLAGEFTEEQIRALKDEPRLTVTETER